MLRRVHRRRASRSRRGGAARACPVPASRSRAASSCRSSGWTRSSRSTPTTSSPWSSPACSSTSSTPPSPPTASPTRSTPASTAPPSAATSNTNAGGMRAVKYGVTRQHVLGLEAVLATGEVHAHRRPHRQGLDGLRPHPAHHRLRGHPRPRHRGHPASLSPRPAHSATVLAPFPTLDEVAAAVPRVAASGLGPGGPRVHRHAHARRRCRPSSASSSASPRRSSPRRWPTSWSRWRAPTPTASTRTCTRCPSCSHGLGAVDVYVLPPGAAAKELIEAREKAFWVAKANNADDIVDIAVPRRAIPEFMATVSEIADANGAWIAGLRPRRRRQRPPRRVPAGPRGPLDGDDGPLPHVHGPRRGHLRRARHRHREEAVLHGPRGPDEGGAHATASSRRSTRPGS